MNLIIWLWKNYVRQFRRRLFFALFLVLVAAALSTVGPQIAGTIVDQVLEDQNFDNFIWLLAGLASAVVLAVSCGWVFRVNFEIVSQNATYNLRKDMYTKIHEMDFDYFATNKVGDIMAKMTGDIDAVRHFISWVFFSLFENLAWLTFALIVLFQIDWLLTLILLTVIPLIGLIASRLVKHVRPTFAHIREGFSSLNSVVSESIDGNRVVKAFAREDFEIEKFQEKNENFRRRNLESAAIWAKYIPPLDGLSGMLSVIVILIGGIFVINDRITLGQLITFNGFLWMLNTPMRMVGWLLNDLQRCQTSLEKIKEMLEVVPKIPLADANLQIKIEGFIEFKNVHFHFEDDDSVAVLKNVSFVAKPGETIGILGETGSGKSTLVNLISRFYDAVAGEVLIDGKNIKEWDARTLRSCISTVMQDVFLFSDTASANIAFANTESDLDNIKRVAQLADAHCFIENLSEGYDTIIGERGTGLSGGQKQRISLARALLKDPTILILDDTTSAVDMETESKIQQDLQKIGADKTTFVIAHRVSSVKEADLILVLNKGEIIERGNHEALLAEDGYYANIYREQLEGGA